MATERTIARVVEAEGKPEGAGAWVLQALPAPGISFVDPFLLLHDFSVSPPAGFPLHPHRGFEIVTYLLEGGFEHGDSAGNKAVVRAGGLQKITAGGGIYHSEAPAEPGANRGLQLWINLSKADKQVEPDYQQLEPEAIPTLERDGAAVRVLAGEGSPVRLRTPAMYLDITVPPGSSFVQPVSSDWQGFVYVLGGRGRFGENGVPGAPRQLLVLGPGDELRVAAEPGESLRFVLGAGRPHHEPVYWRGPFVD